jgi:hypothetical protein
VTLVELNRLPEARAEAELSRCCGSMRWARLMSTERPFASVAVLAAVAQRVWWSLAAADWPLHAERVRKAEYDLDESQVKTYLALERVLHDVVFFAEGFPLLERALRERGFRLAVLPMSEFQKMDGGLSCLSLRF